MKTYTSEELKTIIENHKHWLKGDCDGWEDMKADLREADVSMADVSMADLRKADLRGANLSGAKELDNVQYNEKTSFFAIQCPESGAFEAYKKAICMGGGAAIVHMLVPSTAKRSSATSRKCRVSEAKVLDITSIDGKEEFTEAMSQHDNSFVYRKGDTVKVDNFCDDRWNECAAGIHCFITRREAVNF